MVRAALTGVVQRARLLLAFAVAAALACGAGSRWRESLPQPPRIDAARIGEDVGWLAADTREGRGLGTAGLDASAAYLAAGFAAAGFEPGAKDGSFFQRFEMPIAIQVADAELRVDGVALERGRDFEPVLASADGAAAGGVVFAGYGISTSDGSWDDYAGLDVGGKVALVLDDRPVDPSPLSGSERAAYLSRAYKALNARRHGAVAILVAPSAAALQDPLTARANGANPTLQAGDAIALSVSRATAERIVSAAGGPSLEARQAQIHATGRPASESLERVGVAVRVKIDRTLGTVANVIGVRLGTDPARSHEAVLIGAHYDHLGRGEYGSLTPDRRGEVHNGADDNASGTAGLLALARAFGASPPAARTLVLVAFTGEEAGLVGSAEYARDPAWPLADTITMINLDMIGRLRDRLITVFGAETSPVFRSLVGRASDESGLSAVFEEGATGPSDHTSFYAQGIPVLFFFTGTHPQYHTPDDDAALVDPSGQAAVIGAVYRTAAALLDAPRRPEPRIEAPAGHGGGPAASGPGYGPYLGTVPAFGGAPVRGVRLQAVRPGSPAELAGLRGGDVIVAFDGVAVANLEEFSALLFGARAGQRVEIDLLRDGKPVHTTATLGQRR